MKSSTIFAVFFSLPLGAMCAAPTTCVSWKKYNTASKCCDVDSTGTKCTSKTIVTCGTGKFQDPSNYGNTIMSNSNGVGECCSNVATCSGVTCAAGMKKKSSVTGSTKCPGAASGCQSTCCEKDTTKCGGNIITCASGMWLDTAKAGTSLVNGTDKKVTCCSAMGTCDKVTCSAGYKTKSGVGNTTKCLKSAAMCGMDAACCEKDTKTCGGAGVKCGMNKMLDSSKISTKPTTVDAASCCKDSPHADDCKAAKKGTTSGAPEAQQKAATLVLAITASVAALWA